MDNRFSEHMSYDRNSFIIDGKRRFLTSGTIHYFRVPVHEWGDRLKKAKQAGLNCIETYIAWNYHEPCEQSYDFTGNKDIDEFLRLCKQLDLYVIVRPGPYICAEWDFGGFPAWFQERRGLRPRRYNAVYLRYVKRWFDVLLPKLARQQITYGGPVILMQVENELNNLKQTDLSDREARLYMNALVQMFDEAGIDVPLITCHGGMEGALECINDHEPDQQFARFRKDNPNVPIMCTEFWSGWYSTWTSRQDAHVRSAIDVENATWRILAHGGNGYNYYMWHGGTNFGYNTMYLQTTSYDFTAPLNETGCFNEKYFRTRKVAKYAIAMERILAHSVHENMIDLGYDDEDVWAHRRSGPSGSILFLENRSSLPKEIVVSHDRYQIPVTLSGHEISVVTCDHVIHDSVVLEFTNSIVFENVVFGDKQYFVLYHASGRDGTVQLSGSFSATHDGSILGFDEIGRSTYRYKHASKPQVITVSVAQQQIIFLIVDDTAMASTWTTRAGIYVGPNYVETLDGEDVVYCRDQQSTVYVFSHDGCHERRTANSSSAKGELPVFGDWEKFDAVPEASDSDDELWLGSMEPLDMTLYGTYHGHGWYRTRLQSGEEVSGVLYIEKYADRVHLFVNGRWIKTSAVTKEDRIRHPSFEADIRLQKGDNVIAILVENLGRVKGDWQLGYVSMDNDFKGIEGVYLNWSKRLQNWEYREGLFVEHNGLPNQSSKLKVPNDPYSLNVSRFVLKEPLHRYQHLKLKLTGLYKGVVWINGFNLGRYWMASTYDEMFVPSNILRTDNHIVIYEETDARPDNIAFIYDTFDKSHYVLTSRGDL